MKRTTLLVIPVAVASMLLGGLVFRNGRAGIVRRVHAQEGCSVATLQGNYLFDGRTDAPEYAHDALGFPGLNAGLGTFDGAGNLSQVSTVSNGGNITQGLHESGVYTLGADCTGTITIADMIHFDIFVSSDGSELVSIRTDDGRIGFKIYHFADGLPMQPTNSIRRGPLN